MSVQFNQAQIGTISATKLWSLQNAGLVQQTGMDPQLMTKLEGQLQDPATIDPAVAADAFVILAKARNDLALPRKEMANVLALFGTVATPEAVMKSAWHHVDMPWMGMSEFMKVFLEAQEEARTLESAEIFVKYNPFGFISRRAIDDQPYKQYLAAHILKYKMHRDNDGNLTFGPHTRKLFNTLTYEYDYSVLGLGSAQLVEMCDDNEDDAGSEHSLTMSLAIVERLSDCEGFADSVSRGLLSAVDAMRYLDTGGRLDKRFARGIVWWLCIAATGKRVI